MVGRTCESVLSAADNFKSLIADLESFIGLRLYSLDHYLLIIGKYPLKTEPPKVVYNQFAVTSFFSYIPLYIYYLST